MYQTPKMCMGWGKASCWSKASVVYYVLPHHVNVNMFLGCVRTLSAFFLVEADLFAFLQSKKLTLLQKCRVFTHSQFYLVAEKKTSQQEVICFLIRKSSKALRIRRDGSFLVFGLFFGKALHSRWVFGLLLCRTIFCAPKKCRGSAEQVRTPP